MMEGFFLGYKSSLAAAGGSAGAECRAGGLLPAFPCLALVSHPSRLQNASCREASPVQRPAAGQGLQMSLPQESRPSACFKGFEPYRCRNPAPVHASSPRDRFFYKTCRTVHFHRPKYWQGWGPGATLVPRLSSPPRSPLVLYCESHAFSKATAILYRPKILWGGRRGSPRAGHRWHVTPSFLPGVSSR